jgi:NAD dependent epimerase/dehydratase family enzyme
MPWIHVDDWAALTRRLLEDEAARGPFNMTAPTPVTNAEFTKALGRVLGRPAVLPAPAAALRLALGEMADLLLTGQRALPDKAQALGYRFRFAEVEPALAAVLA